MKRFRMVCRAIPRSRLDPLMWPACAEFARPQQQWYTFIFYALSLAFTKMAILLLYMRILTRGYVRKISYAVLAAVVICNIWVLVSLLIQCIPLQAVWDSSVQGWCLPSQDIGLLNSLLHIVTDFAIFALPIPAVLSLKMARNQKISVVALFGVGFLCVEYPLSPTLRSTADGSLGSVSSRLSASST